MEGSIIKKLFLIGALFLSAQLFAQNTQANVVFHGFPWGTSRAEFTSMMGNPVHVDEVDGLASLLYENVIVSGYPVFLVAYFSQNGLEGGTYYFHTFSLDELIQCYRKVQDELLDRYGPTVGSEIYRELSLYQTTWNMDTGFINLSVDTRQNDPVTLWHSSPALTRMLLGF